MGGERKRLTKRAVECAPSGRTDAYLWDRQVVGFGLKVSPAGGRVYVLQYRFGGRTRRYSIGPHGSPWTVETARERARILLGQIASGEDPQEAKTAARRDLTLAQLCDLYLAEGLATRKANSISSARSDIENHIKPLLGAKRANLITRQEVERLLRSVAEGTTARQAKSAKKQGLSRVRGGRGAANAAVVTLSAAMSFAVAHKIRDDNPAYRVRRYPEKKIERFLSPLELARLGEAIAAAEALGVEHPSAIAALRLLILTGCRKNEILTLKRAHIDSYHRCLRLPDSKTGAKVVHVGAPVMKVIEAIKPTPGNPYLLAGTGGEGHFVNLQKAWDRVREAAGLEDVRLHDLRHAFASLGAARGDSLLVIGALLGHRTASTTERYAHLAAHPVKDAAERISGEMARLLGYGEEVCSPSPEPQIEEEEVDQVRAVLGQVRRARWLDTRAAAALVGHTVGTLQTYRWMGVGPPFRKIGRRVVYDAGELEVWRSANGPIGEGDAPSFAQLT